MGHTPDETPGEDRWVDDVLDTARRGSLDPADAALAEVLASLTADATEDDLVGFDTAVAAFVAGHSDGTSATAPAVAAGMAGVPWLRRRLMAVPVAAMAAAGAVVLAGGMAAAAYTGTLPAPLQDLAHRTIGAPAAHPSPSETVGEAPNDRPSTLDASSAPSTTAPGERSTPTTATAAPGPDASGPAALGLCQAFLHGGLKPGSTAYHELEIAAGSQSITTYCGGVVQPNPTTSSSTSTHPTHPSHPIHTPPLPRSSAPSTTPPAHPAEGANGRPTTPLPRS